MGLFFCVRKNRITRRHVRPDDGPCPDVAVVGHLDYIFHDGLLLPTCAEGATLASIASGASGNVERSNRAAASVCDGGGGVGGAARYLVPADRNEDVQRSSRWLPEVIAVPHHDGDPALKCRGDPADGFIKVPALAARMLDADKQKVVAFFRLLRDCFPGAGILFANRHVDRRGLVLALLRRLGLVVGGVDGFLGAIARFLLQVLFAAGLAFL